MKRISFTEKQIIGVLREHEAGAVSIFGAAEHAADESLTV